VAQESITFSVLLGLSQTSTNTDIFTSSCPAPRFDFTYSDGIRASSSLGGLKHGAEVPWLEDIPNTTPTDVKRSFTPYITFDETVGAGPDPLGTENLLEVCLEQFETVIISEFEKLIHR
jgi:hypothetical protein